ncbi:MAG: lipid-A-disaccharide synthase [Pseudomonadota bacterium]
MSDAFTIFIIAGEESGDHLGGPLMDALSKMSPKPVHFLGVGGPLMTKAGLTSLFPIEDVAVMGFSAVIARLPLLVKRINQTAEAAIEARPDLLLIIDSPDFTHRVARKVKSALPDCPVIDYVCPSVWAWRPKRAEKMTAYVEHVLAILPFEPQVLETLKGPLATFVGHPLTDQVENLTADEVQAGDGGRTLLLLPGSRSGEISRHLPIFRETVSDLVKRGVEARFVLPAVDRHRNKIETETKAWPVSVEVVGSEEKAAVFRSADAALAASGTVLLELALAQTPMISVYKLDPIARRLRFLVRTWTAALPNLILDYPAVPEFIDEFARPALLSRAVERLLSDTPQKRAQLAAFEEMAVIMRQSQAEDPAQRAAKVVLAHLPADVT